MDPIRYRHCLAAALDAAPWTSDVDLVAIVLAVLDAVDGHGGLV